MKTWTRVQRKRTRGWRNPPLTKYLGRGTRWGNKYPIGNVYSRAESLIAFRSDAEELRKILGDEQFIKLYLRPLTAYEHFSCFCPLSVDCHVDFWIEYLNELEADAMTGAKA